MDELSWERRAVNGVKGMEANTKDEGRAGEGVEGSKGKKTGRVEG